MVHYPKLIRLLNLLGEGIKGRSVDSEAHVLMGTKKCWASIELLTSKFQMCPMRVDCMVPLVICSTFKRSLNIC